MANLKSTTINDTGFLQLPSGTTGERPSSPTAGEIRFNTDTKVCEWYDEELDSWFPTGVIPPVATGGDTVEDVDIDGVTYRIHSFTSTGESDFTVTRGGLVDYLIVAGGGAGATTDGGGGGAGGVLLGQQNVKTGTQLIAVGAGGNFIDSDDTAGENGFNSSALGFTAIGGGGGGNDRVSGEQSKSGGSGGGGGSDQGLDQFQGSTGTPGQGNSGGLGVGDTQNITRRSGGGGGAGSPGQPGNGSPNGAGGTGIFVGNIFSLSIGESGFVAGGGGGGHNINGPGGLGGGGDGVSGGGQQADNAIDNTGGGGGGGGGGNGRGGNGGSGVVVIRYRIS